MEERQKHNLKEKEKGNEHEEKGERQERNQVG